MVFKKTDYKNPDAIKARFWPRVNKTPGLGPNGDCWEWTGIHKNTKYGKFSIGPKDVLAHRASYEIHKGLIPEGLCICHTCDNTKCVNPDHLWAGTLKENSSDMVRKKRHIRSKLSDADIELLCRLKETNLYSFEELEDLFELGKRQLYNLIKKFKNQEV